MAESRAAASLSHASQTQQAGSYEYTYKAVLDTRLYNLHLGLCDRGHALRHHLSLPSEGTLSTWPESLTPTGVTLGEEGGAK